jgi:hypothetical protein
MLHIVNITPDAQEDIRFFKAYERRIISSGIRTFVIEPADDFEVAGAQCIRVTGCAEATYPPRKGCKRAARTIT